MISHARQLTQLYRKFYRAKRWKSNNILRPISIAAETVLKADARLFASDTALIETVYGALHASLERSDRESLPYFSIKGEKADVARHEFVEYFVNEVFRKALRGDKSALRGRQLNLLKNACEVIYLDEAAKDKAEREQVETETTETN